MRFALAIALALVVPWSALAAEPGADTNYHWYVSSGVPLAGAKVVELR